MDQANLLTHHPHVQIKVGPEWQPVIGVRVPRTTSCNAMIRGCSHPVPV
jgi:hypothetical protein